MVELRQGGSSREAATANKLTPRPLFNLLYPLSPPPPPAPSLLLLVIPWQEKIWVRCCHRALVSRQPEGACQEPLQNEGAGHSSHFALHKNQDWLNIVDVRRLTVSRKHFLMLYD